MQTAVSLDSRELVNTTSPRQTAHIFPYLSRGCVQSTSVHNTNIQRASISLWCGSHCTMFCHTLCARPTTLLNLSPVTMRVQTTKCLSRPHRFNVLLWMPNACLVAVLRNSHLNKGYGDQSWRIVPHDHHSLTISKQYAVILNLKELSAAQRRNHDYKY